MRLTDETIDTINRWATEKQIEFLLKWHRQCQDLVRERDEDRDIDEALRIEWLELRKERVGE